MPRLIWFALGAVAGMVYASRLIEKENLDKPGALIEGSIPAKQEPKEDKRAKLADMVQQRAYQLSEMIQERGEMIAEKLRSKQAEAPVLVEPVTSPYGQPARMDTREAAIMGSTYEPSLGLESNR